MADHLTPDQRSLAMKRVKPKNGSIEKVVQQELSRCGLKFRCHVRSLPGSPDIVFIRAKIAVFVDGDFWHGWRLSTWEQKLTPFWRDKLRANRARDVRNFRRLRARGWTVIRIWGHQIKNDLPLCVKKIKHAYRQNTTKALR